MKIKTHAVSSSIFAKVINDLKKFKELSDLIIANRMSDEIRDVEKKIYTRDLFNSD